jgi:hypothetical protein
MKPMISTQALMLQKVYRKRRFVIRLGFGTDLHDTKREPKIAQPSSRHVLPAQHQGAMETPGQP